MKKTAGILIISLLFLAVNSYSQDGKSSVKMADDINELKIQQLSVYALPVEGEVVYLTFPDGGNMLINTGKEEDTDKLVKLLKKEITGDKAGFKVMGFLGRKPRIDWLVITEPRADTTGGLEKILNSFKVDIFSNIKISGEPSDMDMFSCQKNFPPQNFPFENIRLKLSKESPL